MVGRGEEHAGKVRHGQSDESHGAAEGGDGAGEQDRREEDQRARALDVEPHRAGVVLAQQKQVERLDDGDGQDQSRRDDREQQGQPAARNVAQRSHGPNDERFEGRLARQVLQDLDHRADARAEHHAEDQDDHDILDAAADGHDDAQHEGCAQPRGAGDAQRLDERVSGDAQQGGAEQEQRHAEPCARTDAQYVGACQRIAEEGLHLEAAGGERRAGEKCRDGFQQTDFQDDVSHRRVACPSREGRPDVAQGHRDRTDGEVGDEECGGEQREQREEKGGALHRLFEAFVIESRLAAAGEDRAQVAQHDIGAHDGRFPEVGTSGRSLAGVVVVDPAVADDGDVGELGVLSGQLGEGVAGADVDPDVRGIGQQVSLFQIDRHRSVRRVPGIDVFPAGVLDKADHVAVRRRHEPRVAVGGVQHHLRTFAGRCGLRPQGFVIPGDPPQRVGAGLAQVAELRGDDEPFGFAQRRLLDVIADVYIGYVQFAEFARDDGVLARHAVEQDDVGTHGREQFEIEVRVVAHVADLAAEAVLPDIGIRDVVDTRNACDAPDLSDGVEHRHMARRHADYAPHGGFDDLSLEIGRGFGIVAQHQQVLFGGCGALPRFADRDECRGVFFRAADVESRSMGRGVNLGRKVA